MQHRENTRRRRQQRRNPILTAAGVAVAAYGTYQLAKLAWEAWQSSSSTDTDTDENEPRTIIEEEILLFEHSVDSSDDLKRVRIQRCRVEASRALMEFLPSLKGCIDGLGCADASECVRELKAIRRRRKKRDGDEGTARAQDSDLLKENELWEIIKVRSMTKYVVGCYSFTILFLLLNVQVHLLGSKRIQNKVLQQSKEGEESIIDALQDGDDSVTNTHHSVLRKTYDHFFQNGIPALAESISKALTTRIASWDMSSSQGIKYETFRHMVKDIRQNFESDPNQELTNDLPLLEYIIQDEHEVDSNDPVVQYILDETWDIVESPPFIGALNECLDIIFHLTQNTLTLFETTTSSPSLAQIISQLKQTLCGLMSEESQRLYVDKLVLVPKVKQLGLSSFDA